MAIRPGFLQGLWRSWLSLFVHVWLMVVAGGGTYLMVMFWGLNPSGNRAHDLFYVLTYAALGVLPIALQTLAAAAIIEATGATKLSARVLIGAATAAAGTMFYARPSFGPGIGSPFFAIVTVGSAIGVGLQSVRTMKPGGSPLMFPVAYVLAVVLTWLVHITV